MDQRKPRIELLTPDLDLSIAFVPGYDLETSRSEDYSAAEIAAIGLALWELSGEPPGSTSDSPWTQSRQLYYRGS